LSDLFKLENAERERLQSLELGISEEEWNLARKNNYEV
jgi:hypothetical protein